MDQCSSQRDDGSQAPLPFQVMHEFNRGWELQDIHELLREINRQFNANVCLLALHYFISYSAFPVSTYFSVCSP